MDEIQLLDAIRSIVQQESAAQTKHMDERMTHMDERMAHMDERGARTDESIARLEERGARTDESIANMSENMAQMNKRMTRIELSYENRTQQILNLLREDYSRLSSAANKVSDYDELKSHVHEHQSALKNHNDRLTELERKAI